MGNTSRAKPSDQTGELVLRLIVIIYLVLGALYATLTPAWQVPDEPAHFNYVTYVAENRRMPELRLGDYPQAYLEELKARRFPPTMSIEPIRYESYQPPLYYMLAALVYSVTRALFAWPMPLTLRAFSLLLGAATLMVSYRLVRAIYPEEPILALGTVAFAATLPMHVAITAGVNNDVLVELLVTLIIGRLVAMGPNDWTTRRTFGLGALLGLAFLAKIWAYIAGGVAIFALFWDAWQSRHSGAPLTWRRVLQCAGLMLGVAALIASPWLAHNAVVYGPRDPLGLARHDQIVAGQLTTRQYIAQHGLQALLRDFLLTSFRSFWGQFGWMGVLLDERIYLALALLSLLAFSGLALYGIRVIRGTKRISPQAKRGLALLAVWALLTVAGYIGYNTKYVQHQGRYLFFAIVPWGLGFTLGLRELFHSRPALPLALLGLLAGALLIWGLVARDIKWYSIALVGLAAIGYTACRWLERLRSGVPMALLYSGMAILSIICLQIYIVPALRS